jgi:hypothetical protein
MTKADLMESFDWTVTTDGKSCRSTGSTRAADSGITMTNAVPKDRRRPLPARDERA